MSDTDFQTSFDVPTFLEHLNAKDPIALVLRAHLYAEAALINLIEGALVRREALDITRFQFGSKLKLAVALGKISPEDLSAYNALTRLRNRFAHDLTTQLVDQDELDLYNTFSVRQRQFADALRKPKMPFMDRLRCDLIGLITLLEAQVNAAKS